MDKLIDSQRIAKSIKMIREELSLTQIEMADMIGYSERQMRRIETDCTLNLGVLNVIAQTFDISVMDILQNGMS